MSFHQPSMWLLVLLPLALLAWLPWYARRRRPAVRYSSLAPLHGAGRTIAVRLRWVLPVLRTLAVALLVVAIARPQKPDAESRVDAEGIAIELVIDRSGSMAALDFRLDGREADRLTVVKSVVEDFVLGEEDLPGRPDDLIGIVSFARYADATCPPTLDHGHVANVLRSTRLADTQAEDGTAIGDAIALALERLRSLDERADLAPRGRFASRVMILLTDGESNAGDIDPVTAAEMAAALGIRIYTIGAGTDGFAEMPFRDVFGRRARVKVSIDEETLQEVAAATGGEYFRARDTGSLEAIYARIDAMEKTKIEQRRYTHFGHPAVDVLALGRVTLPPLLVIVLLLLAAEQFLAGRLEALP